MPLTFRYPGLEKSAAIRPFATEKSRLASENIRLVDSLATESCRLVDRLATKPSFKAGNVNAHADRTWSQGAWLFLLVEDGRLDSIDRLICE